jgi:formyl-CoA transferase
LYPTKDGKMLLIAANQDTVFGRLAEAMGEPELASDPRFVSHAARGQHQQVLDDRVAQWTATLTAEELQQRMDDHGIPAGGIYRAPDMLEDAHFKAREAIITTLHPTFGELKMQNVAPKLSDTPGSVRSAGPELGQHNEEVYLEYVGLSRQEYDDYVGAGVI